MSYVRSILLLKLTVDMNSHFREHTVFKNTKNRIAEKKAEEFDMIGGYFNAYTSRD